MLALESRLSPGPAILHGLGSSPYLDALLLYCVWPLPLVEGHKLPASWDLFSILSRGCTVSSASNTLHGTRAGFIPPLLWQLAAYMSLPSHKLVAAKNPTSPSVPVVQNSNSGQSRPEGRHRYFWMSCFLSDSHAGMWSYLSKQLSSQQGNASSRPCSYPWLKAFCLVPLGISFSLV